MVRAWSARVPAWVAPALVAAVGMTALAWLALVDPETRVRWSPGCPFRMATGLDCPGCGATRAMYALVNGDPRAAADHNVLLLASLPWLARASLRWTLARLALAARPVAVRPATAWALTAVVVGFAVARNVPVWPLSWLGAGTT